MARSTWRTLFGAPRIEAVTPLDRFVLPRARTPLRVVAEGCGRVSVGEARRWFWRRFEATFLVPADLEVVVRVAGPLGRHARVVRVASTEASTLEGPPPPAVAAAVLTAAVRPRAVAAAPGPFSRVPDVAPPRLATSRLAARVTLPPSPQVPA